MGLLAADHRSRRRNQSVRKDYRPLEHPSIKIAASYRVRMVPLYTFMGWNQGHSATGKEWRKIARAAKAVDGMHDRWQTRA